MKRNSTIPHFERLNLILMGNNPMEMGSVLEKIQKMSGSKIVTEIAFDLKSLAERLLSFKPNFIIIDDNIGKVELSETITTLSHNRKTKNIPITVLKNSNYQESLGSVSIVDYVLKQQFTSESLVSILKNCLKFRKTQLYLHKVYSRKRNQYNYAS
jgi:CheY-like chemotaxis protein